MSKNILDPPLYLLVVMTTGISSRCALAMYAAHIVGKSYSVKVLAASYYVLA